MNKRLISFIWANILLVLSAGNLFSMPCDDCVSGVENFAKISEAIWRGAQPTNEGFKELEKMGLVTVVNFRHDHDDVPLLKGTKLKYIRIPSRAWKANIDNIVQFLKVVENRENWPIFIHCAQGRDRTGYNAAAYRIVFQNWSHEEALAEMSIFRFNKIWLKNPDFIKQIDPKAIKERLQTTTPPTLRTFKW